MQMQLLHLKDLDDWIEAFFPFVHTETITGNESQVGSYVESLYHIAIPYVTSLLALA